MCDTFVALPNHSASGNLIFGKNSDREPNEAQAIVRLPARDTHTSNVRCTFIELPQVARTHEVILSKPFQMWGAEMGINEHGVVIGNEAVFTKVKTPKTNNGLTGMDMLRLALERTGTAKEAVQTITGLLEAYGQDVCSGYRNKNLYYHNSFLIADATSAWVLETADRHWVAQRVENYRAISNGLTIESDYDLISADAIEFAIRKGWAKPGEPFSFRAAYSDWLFTKGSNCRRRQQHSNELGQAKSGRFEIPDAIEILRSHECPDSTFRPSKSTTASICMHASGVTNPSQSNGSMIAEVRTDSAATVWLTGTSMPCLSVYLPFFFGDSASHHHPLAASQWNIPGEQLDESLWWQAEHVHRRVCRNYHEAAEPLRQFGREMQLQLLESERRLCKQNADIDQRSEFSQRAVDQLRQFILESNRDATAETKFNAGYLYRYYWSKINRQAGMA